MLQAGVSEVDVTDDQNLVVIPIDDTVRIQLGHSDYLKRYRTHMEKLSYYRDLMERFGDIESIDLRYEKQIVYQRASGTQTAAVAANPGRKL